MNRTYPSAPRRASDLLRAACPRCSLFRPILAAAALLAFAASASAQISLTSGNLSYAQNFNHGYEAGTITWTDNSTLTGWYIHRNASGSPTSLTALVHTPSTPTVAGNSSLGAIHLIADTDNPTNFGLGMRINDTNGSTPATPGAGYYFGLLLRNDTGATITSFDFSYTGFQFYHSTGANANTLTAAYQTFASDAVFTSASLTAGTWTAIADSTYTTPFTAAGANTGLDFNAPGNFTHVSATAVTGLTWADGDYLMLRLYNQNVSGVDQGIGFDNISFTATAIPEPSTYAAWLGVCTLLLVARRRRRSAT